MFSCIIKTVGCLCLFFLSAANDDLEKDSNFRSVSPSIQGSNSSGASQQLSSCVSSAQGLQVILGNPLGLTDWTRKISPGTTQSSTNSSRFSSPNWSRQVSPEVPTQLDNNWVSSDVSAHLPRTQAVVLPPRSSYLEEMSEDEDSENQPAPQVTNSHTFLEKHQKIITIGCCCIFFANAASHTAAATYSYSNICDGNPAQAAAQLMSVMGNTSMALTMASGIAVSVFPNRCRVKSLLVASTLSYLLENLPLLALDSSNCKPSEAYRVFSTVGILFPTSAALYKLWSLNSNQQTA